MVSQQDPQALTSEDAGEEGWIWEPREYSDDTETIRRVRDRLMVSLPESDRSGDYRHQNP